MEFQHIKPRELTVWHLDDAEPPRREVRNFVETELPQGVEHKECLGPRDFAISLAKAIKNGDLRKYNAIISDGLMDNTYLSDNNPLPSREEIQALDLFYAYIDLRSSIDGTKEVLKRNKDTLTNDGRAFLLTELSSGTDLHMPEAGNKSATENFPLNQYERITQYCRIPKNDPNNVPLNERLSAFLEHFDYLVGLRKEA